MNKELANKYPLIITAQNQDGEAMIRIDGLIYSWTAESFRYAIDELIAKGVTNAKVYLNTMGGNVFVANEIIEQMQRLGGEIHGYGGEVVASAGSYLASYFDTFEMSPNGQFMYHKPSAKIEGNEDEVESRLKLLKNLTTLYRERYAAKTGKTTDEIEENWAKGDVWLTAQEAMDQGFVTSVAKDKAPVTKETALMIAACGAPIKPEVNKQPDNKTKMKNREVIISKLGLAKDATDEQINAALDEVLAKSEKVEALEASAKKTMDTAIDAMLDAAVSAKKINETQREHFKVLAQKDFDNTKSLLESMAPAVKVSGQLNPKDSGDVVKTNWTMQDYIDKDLDGLEALMESDPGKYKKLEKAHYGN